MYLKKFKIQNVRSIAQLDWDVPEQAQAGWHVILGDNGSGKSTVLRAIALALVGPKEAEALREDWNSWLRKDQNSGSITLSLDRDPKYDHYRGRGQPLKNHYHSAHLTFAPTTDSNVQLKGSSMASTERHVWGSGAGWFSAGYGPFRRFAGGDKEAEKLYYAKPQLARHLSVFGESIALTKCIRWLQDLKFRQLEGTEQGHLLEAVKSFVNQDGFLPHGATLAEVTSRDVVFVDGNGARVPINDMSDGYRSILSMTFELIRQMSTVYEHRQIFSNDRTKVSVPGVVLIDEIDAHLHPSWQRRIGGWLTKHFPLMQFIVTTHSPLICYAAERGTIFRLPQPGTDEPGRMVEGEDRQRLLYGNVLDAYSTDMFGEKVGRSDAGRDLLRRLAELNKRELIDGLKPAELKEREGIRLAMPTRQHALTVVSATEHAQ